jgi:hypothetical protein
LSGYEKAASVTKYSNSTTRYPFVLSRINKTSY